MAGALSIATIREDGAFFRFSGYQRNISVQEGEGMFLSLGSERSALTHPFQAMDFNGNGEGPLLDVNVIYHCETTLATVRWMPAEEWQYQQGVMLLFNAVNALNITVYGSDAPFACV